MSLGFGVVVGEDGGFSAHSKQRRDDIALQEVDDCHAVVGGDEDSFGHYFRMWITKFNFPSIKELVDIVLRKSLIVAPVSISLLKRLIWVFLYFVYNRLHLLCLHHIPKMLEKHLY